MELLEGFYLKGSSFFVGVQWHPERHPGKASLVLWQSFQKRYNKKYEPIKKIPTFS